MRTTKVRLLTLVFLFFLGLAVIAVPVLAKSGHMKLLAVRETENGLEGSDADLFLEVRKGSGRVYLDTLPLTKLDTQMSTRFAKQVACNFLNINCDNLDFFYTIRSDSVIVGGPSAGAAATILTISLLDGQELDEKVAMTGTINSGGLVGVVDGVKQKIEAAKNIGMTKVLVASGNTVAMQGNETMDLVGYGKSIGVEVVEVPTINEALYQFTGKKYDLPKGDLVVPEKYKETMRMLAELLCNRSRMYDVAIADYASRQDIDIIKDEVMQKLMNDSFNLTQRAAIAIENDNGYSAASFCYGSNVKKSELFLRMQNLSSVEMRRQWNKLIEDIDAVDAEMTNKPLNTLQNLQAYIIVKERIDEARQLARESLNSTSTGALAYASERLYSATVWSKFFDENGNRITLNDKILQESCLIKLGEAEERYQYITLLFPGILDDTRKLIERAKQDHVQGDDAMCLFRSSKAKAEANSVLNALGVSQEQADSYLRLKADVTQSEILREIEKGVFPILAYSYYEYANDLRDEDQFSSLLYLDYALEMSNFDWYLKEQRRVLELEFDSEKIALFVIGILSGAVITVILVHRKYQGRIVRAQQYPKVVPSIKRSTRTKRNRN